MSHNQLPSIGRIVHFVDEHDNSHAAIITGVGPKNEVILTVFPNPYTLLGNKPTSFSYGPLPHEDDKRAKGEPFWRWPPYIPPTKTPAEAEIDNPRLTPQGG